MILEAFLVVVENSNPLGISSESKVLSASENLESVIEDGLGYPPLVDVKVRQLPGRRWRHKKRGTTYIQIAGAMGQGPTPEIEGQMFVVYASEDDGSIYVRPASEFNDGRFEEIE